MINAKKEFIKQITNRGLVCAKVLLCEHELDEHTKVVLLKKNYTEPELQTFLESLDFDYDNGFGIPKLFGFIWHTDLTWSERHNYNGAECWRFQETPIIPKELLY